MRNYFTLNGVDSRDFGVYISGQGTFNASGRGYNIIPVPGRNGDLIGPEKRLQNGTLTYPAFIYTNFKQNIEDFRNFLLSLVGYHDLVDTYHPNEIRKVCFTGPFDADVESKNDAGKFDITFTCKPQRYLASGNEVTTFDSAGETETFSGSIVTFDNPDVATVNALSTAINPIQDLHGYDYPWPAGGGKNKLVITAADIKALNDITWNDNVAVNNGITFTILEDAAGNVTGIQANGTASATAKINISKTDISQGIYYLSDEYYSSTAFIRGVFRDANGVAISVGGGVFTDLTTGEAYREVPSNVACINVYITINSGANVNNVIFRPMLRYSTESGTFAPYSNICPISGWDAVGIEATGVNLCDISTTMIGRAWNYATVSNRAALFVRLKYGVQYTLSKSGNGSLDGVYYGYKNEITDKTTWDGGDVSAMSSNSVTVSMPSQTAKYLVVGFNKSNITQADVEAVNLQLETGSTATAFKPYSGNTYAIALGQTVYGGTLDVTNGTLTVDRAVYTIPGGNSFGNFEVGTNTCRCYLSAHNFSPRIRPNISTVCKILCDTLPAYAPDYIYRNDVQGISENQNASLNGFWIRINNSLLSESTLAGMQAYFAQHPITICYPLATPVEIQLDPVQIAAISGQTNNVWANTGDITATIAFQQYQFTITNPTLFDSQPLLRVYGTGILGIGSQQITITQADVYTDIDCEMMDAYKGTESKNGLVEFENHLFPVFVPGVNNISLGAGITQIDITPRWWLA